MNVNAAAVLATVFVLLSSSGSGAAPGYLSQMPSVAEVQRHVRGSDALATASRQAAVLRELSWTIRKLSKGGEFGDDMTSEERKLFDAYSAAAQKSGTTCYELAAKRPGSKAQNNALCQPPSGILAEAYPALAKLAAERKQADTLALHEAERRTKGSGDQSIWSGALLGGGIMLAIFAVGGALTLAGLKILGRAKTGTDALRKEEFYRRGEGGVLGFETFEAAEAHRMKRAGNSVEAIAGIFVLLFGLGIFGVGMLILQLVVR